MYSLQRTLGKSVTDNPIMLLAHYDSDFKRSNISVLENKLV